MKYGCEGTLTKEIRDSALAWVKEITAQGDEGYVGGINITPCEEYTCHAVKDWIKNFFNITEEDLK